MESKSIRHHKVEERGFGYLPQNLALFPHLSVEENLRYGIKARRLNDPSIEAHLQELIDTVDIRPLLRRKPETLSGGERQRVALVRALAPRPRLLLLDEPFSALDPSLRWELWTLVRRIQEEFRTTMLLITHDLAEAYFLSSRISVIIGGKIQQSGPREEIFFHPKELEVARYLGIRNIFEAIFEARDGEVLRFKVPALSTSLNIQSTKQLHPGKRYHLAIRSEHIQLADSTEKPNILEGEIQTLPMGGSTLGLFTPVGSRQALELQLHGHQILQGKAIVWLPQEHIVLLPSEENA